ncbi:hypothetical protein OJF2_09660 [Aquisphaera giovannonii]|uniref:Uncharacterized protein n=1 Tax=Aquisphaera giovannonii TaxID=406548 RepID=A0A5B9VWM5_9BACT|nr:hypothetical protein [Aquisphaera giovannonii]QEH32489.1 hypothetical protein OJF2_09660 [Aquisphaera giovannonii]
MPQIRCRFCHESVDAGEIRAHEAEHLKPRPDGQQSEYVTLPPEERAEGDLAGVPRAYVHRKCGAGTGMPEEIIRSYLKDPFLYTAEATYCCGCRRHVPWRECRWVETGEDLETYFRALQAAKPEMRPGPLARLVILLARLFRR